MKVKASASAKKFDCMKIESFEYLRKQGASGRDMTSIIRYKVVPALNISYDELVIHSMEFIYANQLWDYPVWEVHLNVLMQKYRISKNEIENMLVTAIND